MRNPWERRVSQYFYAKRMTEQTGEDWAMEISLMSFYEFITKPSLMFLFHYFI